MAQRKRAGGNGAAWRTYLEGMRPRVVLHALTGASPAQAAFVARAIERLDEALTAPGWCSALAAARYTATCWTPASGPGRALTGAEVAERIADGRERGSLPDATLDLSLNLIDLPGPASKRKVLGSTMLGVQPVNTARWFVEMCADAGDPVNLASHFAHEWCHVSGFYHWPDNKARGDVAYVVGRLVREMLEPRYASEIVPAITTLMHDRETDCGCRGNPPDRTE